MHDNEAKLGRPKRMDFEAVFQALEAKVTCSIWNGSGELGISHSSVVSHLHNLGKHTGNCRIMSYLTKKNAKILTHQSSIDAFSRNLIWRWGCNLAYHGKGQPGGDLPSPNLRLVCFQFYLQTHCYTKIKKLSLPYYLLMAGEGVRFMHFTRVLEHCKIKTA